MKYPFIPLLVLTLFFSAGSSAAFAKHYKNAPEATTIETAPETGVDPVAPKDQGKKPPAQPAAEEPASTVPASPKTEPAASEAEKPAASDPQATVLAPKEAESQPPATTAPEVPSPEAKPSGAQLSDDAAPKTAAKDLEKSKTAAIEPKVAEKPKTAAPKAKAPRKAKKAKAQQPERPLTLEEMVAIPGTYKSPDKSSRAQPAPRPAPKTPAAVPKDQSRAPDASQKRSARHMQLHDYNTTLDNTGVMKNPVGDTGVSRASTARQNKRIEESARLRNQPDHLIKDRRAYEDSFKSIHDRQASPSYWEDKRNVRTGPPSNYPRR